MFARVLLAAALSGSPSVEAAQAVPEVIVVEATTVASPDTTLPGRTPPTINEFLPEERSIGECISALPKPGCGSEARGGWRQGLILLAILVGMAFIAWRIVRATRAARRPMTGPDLSREV